MDDGSPSWIRIEPCALRPKGLFAGFWRKCGQIRAGDASGTLYGTRGMRIAAREPAPAKKLAQSEGRVFRSGMPAQHPGQRGNGARHAARLFGAPSSSIDADRPAARGSGGDDVGRTFRRLDDLDDTSHATKNGIRPLVRLSQPARELLRALPSDRPGDVEGAHQRAKRKTGDGAAV